MHNDRGAAPILHTIFCFCLFLACFEIVQMLTTDPGRNGIVFHGNKFKFFVCLSLYWFHSSRTDNQIPFVIDYRSKDG